METVEFTNSLGQSVKFADAPFFIQSVTGLGDVSANIQLQKSAYNDGSSFIDALLDEREIGLEFLIVANAEARETYGDVSRMREHVATVLNPKLGQGVLKYENERIVRLITCVADSVPQFNDGGDRTEMIQNGSVNFIAPDPYWKSTKIEEEPAFKPLFQFPFSGPFQMGLQQDKRIINNDGNAPTPIFIEFHGPAVNPVIKNNTTGEFIKVNQHLLEGERMIIDTSADNKTVCFVSEDGTSRNVFHWITLDSTLFNLQIGENEIEYTADNDIQGAIVNISYNKLYNAV